MKIKYIVFKFKNKRKQTVQKINFIILLHNHVKIAKKMK